MKNKALYPKIYFFIVLVLFITTMLSCALFVMVDLLSFEKDLFLWPILPLICPVIIWLIERKFDFKHPRIFKIIAHILNILNIIFQCFIILVISAIALFGMVVKETANEQELTDIKDYQKALEKYTPETVAHFPKAIPENAKNIHFVYTPGGFLGDSTFYLQFDTDKEYIQKVKNKYKNAPEEYAFKGKHYKTKQEDYDYDEHRAASAIIDCSRKSNNKEHSPEIGYTAKILTSGGCISGFATKNNNIIYLVYCD